MFLALILEAQFLRKISFLREIKITRIKALSCGESLIESDVISMN